MLSEATDEEARVTAVNRGTATHTVLVLYCGM